MTIWFTADEHYSHAKIIEHCKRPFATVEEMNETIIRNHNSVVVPGDTVWHLGDFVWKDIYTNWDSKLNGIHKFIKGNHDRQKTWPSIEEITIEGQRIVLCHYAMRVWSASHYGAWQLYGHSHGTLAPLGKQYDVGVDNNNFFPISFEELKEKLDNVELDFANKLPQEERE